jgi:Ca2+-binding EF-hand superfamily protein
MLATKTEADQVIHKYTGGIKAKLEYQSFLQLILPYNSHLRFVSVQKISYKVPKYTKLNEAFEYSLAKLIKKEIDLNSRLEGYKLALRSRPDFDVFAVFKLIDQTHLNYINEDNLSRFLRERKREDVSEMFVKGLDIDMDGRLFYNEFRDGILPYTSEVPLSHTSIYYPKATHPELSSGYSNSYMSPYKTDYYKEAGTESSLHRRLDYEVESKTNQMPNEFASIIKEQLRIESQLEKNKAALLSQADFNLMDAFRMIDNQDKCFVTLYEFKEALKRLGVPSNDLSVEMLYKRYNKDCNGKFQFSDFCEMMLPKEASSLNIIYKRSPSGEEVPKLSKEAIEAFKMILKESLELELAGEEIRLKFNKNPKFNLCRLFEDINRSATGYISLNEVMFILRLAKSLFRQEWVISIQCRVGSIV